VNFFEFKPNFERFKTAILFASYEERCANVAGDLITSGFRGEVHILYCEDLPKESIKPKLHHLKSLFTHRIKMVPVLFRNPIPAIHAARKFDWEMPVLLDVSCFNRGNLFPFLWASALGIDVHPEISFAYSAPRSYGDWLSADYEEPKNIVGFSGGLEFARDRVLICAVGYETGRAIAVIRAAEPSRVILTVGTIPTLEEFCERNLKTVDEVHGSRAYEVHEIDVSDPSACKRDLESLTANFIDGTEVSFAPFSTKLSCLAIWALWLKDSSIRLWNAQPGLYNLLDYSKGSTKPRYFRVDWSA
jgi:hypothetical protein